MMKIFGDHASGNCYKVKLIADLLKLEYQWQAIDILAGDTKSAEFLSKSPNGKIPLLELNNGQYLTESNAIINYLAHESFLLPKTPLELAKVQQWQFFEQYSHEPYIAVARFINKYLGLPTDRQQEYFAKQAGGHKALQVMEQQLTNSPYLIGQQLTTADISLYAYTHVANEGGFELANYPAIQAWLTKIEKHPNYTSLI